MIFGIKSTRDINAKYHYKAYYYLYIYRFTRKKLITCLRSFCGDLNHVSFPVFEIFKHNTGFASPGFRQIFPRGIYMYLDIVVGQATLKVFLRNWIPMNHYCCLIDLFTSYVCGPRDLSCNFKEILLNMFCKIGWSVCFWVCLFFVHMFELLE